MMVCLLLLTLLLLLSDKKLQVWKCWGALSLSETHEVHFKKGKYSYLHKICRLKFINYYAYVSQLRKTY